MRTDHGMGFVRKVIVTFGFTIVFLTGLGVGPAHANQFAAIWKQGSGPAWVARHGMTSDGYQQEFDKFVAQGYRLEFVSGY